MLMKRSVLALAISVLAITCIPLSAFAGAKDDLDAGDAAVARGEYREAIRLFDKVLDSDKLTVGAQSYVLLDRGHTYSLMGQHDKAVQDYNQSIKLYPNHAAYNVLAWLYATCRDQKYLDGKRAVEFALKLSLIHI